MPRFNIRSRNIIATYDEAYMEEVERQSIVEGVETKPDYLYVFLDEMGNETLPPNDTLFGIGGCAFVGTADIDGLNDEWRELRKSIFKVPEANCFHSNRHFKKLKSREHRVLADFFQRADLRYFASYIRTGAHVSWEEDILNSVVNSLSWNVSNLINVNVNRVEWYFEHSRRLSPKLMLGVRQPRYARASENGGVSFILKSAMVPAIEIADLVCYIVGSSERKKGRDKLPFLELMTVLFGERRQGACSEVLGSFYAFDPGEK